MADINPKIAAQPILYEPNQPKYDSIYQLKCFYKVDTPVYTKDLPEIDRKAAIIMACHLLHEAHEHQKSLRSLVAAEIYKKMPDINHLRESFVGSEILYPRKDRLGISFGTFIFVPRRDDHRVVQESFQVQGSQEIVVGQKFFATISYLLTMTHCVVAETIQYALEMFDGMVPSPEPHYSWGELIDQVDRMHNYPTAEDWEESGFLGEKFSTALADRAIHFSAPRFSYMNTCQIGGTEREVPLNRYNKRSKTDI